MKSLSYGQISYYCGDEALYAVLDFNLSVLSKRRQAKSKSCLW